MWPGSATRHCHFSLRFSIGWMSAVGCTEMLSAKTSRIPAAFLGLKRERRESLSYLLWLKTACLPLLSKEWREKWGFQSGGGDRGGTKGKRKATLTPATGGRGSLVSTMVIAKRGAQPSSIPLAIPTRFSPTSPLGNIQSFSDSFFGI